jgi:hypothetical protein
MRFAAIGLDHCDIHDLTQGLLDGGLKCAGYCPETTDTRVGEYGTVPGFEDFGEIVPRTEAAHVDRARLPLTYFGDIAHDVAHRTATAMSQRHAFTVTRWVLEAQARAVRFMPRTRA